jgi:hypothetical protein
VVVCLFVCLFVHPSVKVTRQRGGGTLSFAHHCLFVVDDVLMMVFVDDQIIHAMVSIVSLIMYYISTYKNIICIPTSK